MNHKLIRIGRAAQNDWLFSNPEISGEHAQLFQDSEGLFFLTDLNSKAGVFVNGKRIHGAVQIKPGDKVNLAGIVVLDWEGRLGLDNDGFQKTMVGPEHNNFKQKNSKLIPILSLAFLMISIGTVVYFFSGRKNEVSIHLEPEEKTALQISQFDFDAVNAAELTNYVGYTLVEAKKTSKYFHPSGCAVVLTEDMVITEIECPSKNQESPVIIDDSKPVRKKENEKGSGESQKKQMEKSSEKKEKNNDDLKVITENQTYIVKKGDTIGSIVDKFRLKGCNTTKNKVIEANPSIADPDNIQEGKKIHVPC